MVTVTIMTNQALYVTKDCIIDIHNVYLRSILITDRNYQRIESIWQGICDFVDMFECLYLLFNSRIYLYFNLNFTFTIQYQLIKNTKIFRLRRSIYDVMFFQTKHPTHAPSCTSSDPTHPIRGHVIYECPLMFLM